MNQEQLSTLLDDLVAKHGVEDVVSALAQATLNQATRISAMGHEPQAQEMLVIAEALVGMVEVTQE